MTDDRRGTNGDERCMKDDMRGTKGDGRWMKDVGDG